MMDAGHVILIIVLFILAGGLTVGGLLQAFRPCCPSCQKSMPLRVVRRPFAFCPYCGKALHHRDDTGSSEVSGTFHDDERLSSPSESLVRPLCPACWQSVQTSDSYCGNCGEPIQKERKAR